MSSPSFDLPLRRFAVAAFGPTLLFGVGEGAVLAVLADQGYATLEAADGPAAVGLLESQARIDLLLTDVGLPGLNGQQVAERARQCRPDIRVLFMTGYVGRATTRAEWLGPGMQMIVKPFAVQALEQAIDRIMGK